jgi:CrcB protein
MYKLGLIFLGSGLGGVARFTVAGAAQRLNPQAGFPIGTLLVNLTGCLAIGFLSAALTSRSLMREEFRVALLVGVLGGYTTFSTFGWETFAMLNGGQFVRAALNALFSVIGCLTAVWAGYRTAQYWLGA